MTTSREPRALELPSWLRLEPGDPVPWFLAGSLEGSWYEGPEHEVYTGWAGERQFVVTSHTRGGALCGASRRSRSGELPGETVVCGAPPGHVELPHVSYWAASIRHGYRLEHLHAVLELGGPLV